MTPKENPSMDLDELRHGKLRTYQKRGCRCDDCRAAKAEYERQWYARNQEHVRERQRRWREAHPEYSAWRDARYRTTDPRNKEWANYGGRGIRMAPEWLDSFEAFLAHIGPRPSPEYSLERIDNDGHYELGNVKWATRSEQARNRRRVAPGAAEGAPR